MKELILKEVKNGYMIEFQDEVYVERSIVRVQLIIAKLMTRARKPRCRKILKK